MNTQTIADTICDHYKISHIRIEHSNKMEGNGGIGCYHSYRYKGHKHIYPKKITLYKFADSGGNGEIAHVLGHELAHHVCCVKHQSLRHDNRHGKLSDDIGMRIWKLLK